MFKQLYNKLHKTQQADKVTHWPIIYLFII